MAGALPRIARVPHTEKRPERCPYCGSTDLSRKGTRRKKIEIVQLWRCASCKRIFTPTPAELRNKTYPLRIVLDAITLYDLGYSLDETAEKVRTSGGHRVARSTIGAWLSAHRSLMTYARLRARGRQLYPSRETIRAIKLYHRQVYRYAYHRTKLAFTRDGTLDAKRIGDTKFAKVADFLVVEVSTPETRRYLVIAPGSPDQLGRAVQVQMP